MTSTRGEEIIHHYRRPPGPFHAHFDCFSGAAGDMLLAACLDVSDDPPQLLAYVIQCLRGGLVEIANDFDVTLQKVQRGTMGSVAASYVKVHSRYKHAAAPVPSIQKENYSSHAHDDNRSRIDRVEDHHGSGQNQIHDHDHGHAHDHEHGHGHEQYSTPETKLTHDHDIHPDTTTDHNPQHSLPLSFQEAWNTRLSAAHEDFYNDDDNYYHYHTTNLSNAGPSLRLPPPAPLRNLPQIQEMLEKAAPEFLTPWVRDTAIQVFTELAQAEAKTHGADSTSTVFFHEVGAIDSIVDTVGTLIALQALGVTTCSCSRLPLGEGTCWGMHGLMPVPAPATLRLMQDMPVCSGPPGITGELVTPTGASLLRVLTRNYRRNKNDDSRPPLMTIRSIGHGAGTKDYQKHPNIVRLILGDSLVQDDKRTG